MRLLKTTYILFICFLIPSIVKCQYKPTGHAILVGLDRLNNEAYQKKYNKIYGTKAVAGVKEDLKMMEEILGSSGYKVTILKNEKATNTEVLKTIRNIGNLIRPGDYFILYFSGHGDFIKDKSGDELSGNDQVLVTYNDYVLDDSLHKLFKTYFTKSINAMLVDACHSGTSYKIKMSVLDFEIKATLKTTEKFHNQAVVQKKEITNSPCSYTQTDEASEPYRLFYYGAVRDDKEAIGTPAGGILTLALYEIYSYYTQQKIWESITWQQLACEINQITENQGQRIQYHEIGPIDKTIKNQTPFKTINP